MVALTCHSVTTRHGCVHVTPWLARRPSHHAHHPFRGVRVCDAGACELGDWCGGREGLQR